MAHPALVPALEPRQLAFDLNRIVQTVPLFTFYAGGAIAQFSEEISPTVGLDFSNSSNDSKSAFNVTIALRRSEISLFTAFCAASVGNK